MKALIVLVLGISLSASALALEFKVSMKTGPKLAVSCAPHESFCRELCGESECSMDTNLCKDCVGSSLFLTELYRSVGRSLLPAEQVPQSEVISSLKTTPMMVVDRRFFLNIQEDYNSFDFKEYYARLCNYEDEMPILFVPLRSNLAPQLLRILVFCRGSQDFRILRYQ